ncbi:MAG: septation protein SepH [Actinomycetota bacterium]|nr:DUF3071 domain-containing protein [Actinomycetota bacterium]
MIKLRVVGYSDDLKNLILTSRKQGRKGSHLTPIDDKMFDVLEDVWRLRKSAERDEKKASRAAEVPAESKLPPREVQRQLRAGKSPEEVAEMAGVDIGWVERFYSMVLHERAGVIADVQSMWVDKQRLGPSGAPLGEAVLHNLRNRHVRLSDDDLAEAWDATRRDGQPWVVALEFPFRGRKQRAVWRYDPHARTVVAANRLAADLGWVKNGKKAAARQVAERTTRAGKKSARKAPRKAPRKAARRAAKKVARRPVRKVTRRPAKKTARRPAKKTARRPVAKKKAARRATRKTASRRAAPRRSARRR